MDYSKALNTGLGLVEEPIAEVKVESKKVKNVRQESHIQSARDSSNEVQFDAKLFTIRESLMEGLAKYVGSKLEIAKNGAVTFIFGKTTSK